MAEDPYSVLGVSRTSSDDEIRKAFRRLAKELHPDVNPGKEGEERFKRVASANDILSDGDRRKQYDRGEIDANGDPVHAARGPSRGARGGRGFDDFGFADVFTDIFGSDRSGRANLRGADVRYTLDVEFLEAVSGAKKRVTLPDGGILDLAVPEGVHDGQVLRLKGKGGPGAERGDALVEVKVRPHSLYKRVGDDVSFELPISIDEAVLGGKVEVATVAGRVQLNLPKGTNSGQIFRLKGKGVKNAGSGLTGDSLVTIRIVMPPVIDDGLAYFFSEWRQKNKYDPGRP
jgi:DnaJ-class molecular chaperone